MDELNRRYQLGRPSSDLASAGVVLHTFDELDDRDEPWLPISRTHPDERCSLVLSCSEVTDRLCASIVWAGLAGELRRHLFFERKGGAFFGGFVFSPAHNLLNCAYGGDGGTNRKRCSPPGRSSSCVPGPLPSPPPPSPPPPPPPPSPSPPSTGCGQFCGEGGGGGQCSTRLEHLHDLLEYQAQGGARTGTNELVFDQQTFEERLPHSVDAIWFDPQRSDGSRERVIHQRFCQRFGLRPEQVPFVRLLQGGSGPIFGT